MEDLQKNNSEQCSSTKKQWNTPDFIAIDKNEIKGKFSHYLESSTSTGTKFS